MSSGILKFKISNFVNKICYEVGLSRMRVAQQHYFKNRMGRKDDLVKKIPRRCLEVFKIYMLSAFQSHSKQRQTKPSATVTPKDATLNATGYRMCATVPCPSTCISRSHQLLQSYFPNHHSRPQPECNACCSVYCSSQFLLRTFAPLPPYG